MGGRREKPGKERIEPTLGGNVHGESRHVPPVAVPLWRERRVWRWALLVVAVLALLLVTLRQPLAQWLWPDTRVQRLLDAGDAALEAGRLSAADGSGARQLFEAAQALDSDRNEARAGLTRVANAALGQARVAMRAQRLDEANRSLALARELQAPRGETEAVAAELRRLQAASTGIDEMLRQAQIALAEQRLDGDEAAALPLYRQVLSLQPDNLAALEGREDALSDLLQQARRELAAGKLVEGAAKVAAARGYDPGHAGLPDLQAQLSRATEQVRKRADVDLRAGRLERALTGYRALAESAMGDAVQSEAAAQGISRIATDWATQARRQAADFHFDAAERSLAQARDAAPDNGEVAAAGEYLQRVRKSQVRPTQPLLSPAQRQAQVRSLLAAMDRARVRAHWLTPPGESAYDQLRAAQALAADDKAVLAAATRLAASVRSCFEDNLNRNQPTRAQGCLDAWIAVVPGDSRQDAARRRLAAKWLAVGAERLDTGDVAFATTALDRARALDEATPGLAQFAQRVRDARAGID